MKLKMRVQSHHQYSESETLVQLLALTGKDACNFTVPSAIAAEYPLGQHVTVTVNKVDAPKEKKPK